MTETEHANLKHRIKTFGQLPTLPQIVQKIMSVIDRPETSAEGLGRLIEKDQVLSAKVLQLANSPCYGFPDRIASVSHAVVVLGLNVVKGLKAEFAPTVAGGQGALKGQILRVAHLGYYDATDTLGLLATLEVVLQRLGHRFPPGAGMAAAEAEYLTRTAGR